MNILVVSQRFYPDTFGGSEHVASEQARRLAQRGHRVTFIAERTSETLPAAEEQGNLQIYRYGTPRQLRRIGGSSRTALSEIPRLLQTMTPRHFEVAIAHHPFPAYAFLRSRISVPLLYIFHTAFAPEAALEVIGIHRALPFLLQPLRFFFNAGFIYGARFVERRALAGASKIAVLSNYTGKLLQNHYSSFASKLIPLTVGIDQQRFRPAKDKPRARRQLGLPIRPPLLLTVRRFTPRMGIVRLIKAMEEIVRTHPQAKLLIIGEGPLKAAIAAEIKRRVLAQNVTCVGAVSLDELPIYYQAADLFVLPSQAYEGLGMATLEALASGLPVVGTPAGATPEILNQLDYKLIAKSTDTPDLAERIRYFLKLTDRQRLGYAKKARQLAEEHYQWDRAIRELEKLLKTLAYAKI